MNKDDKIYIAGHRGLVGSSIIRNLESKGFNNIIGRTKSELDLREQNPVRDFFEEEKPDYVFLAAAKVGGINWNKTNPAEFIYDNLSIQNHVIDAAYRSGVKKFMFLGSACIYPKVAEVPIKEESLMTGPLEPSNEGYALSKIAGMRMCAFYRRQYNFDAISVMPANLYGPKDNFIPEHGHVIPGLIRKMFDAKTNKDPSVTCWGDGSPTREFLYVDDLADACIFLMDTYSKEEFVNVGSDVEIKIKDLAEMIKEYVGYEGELIWDTSRPNGTPKRVMDNSKLFNMGWSPKVEFEQGLKQTIKWYMDNKL
mgnify:FL=1|tara:strand:- start:531 stop:1460 length:930 start_codon:yes stop_codon:yes gene_type:complete